MKAFRFATLLLLLLTACYEPRTTKEECDQVSAARINLGGDPNTLDPRKARDLFSVALTRMLYEGLTYVNPSEKLELALAEGVSISQDLKTYTFHLRESSWSNGDPVTAHDFVYAWKKVLDPNFPADNAFQLYVIKGAKAAKCGEASLDEVAVKAIDERTLEVKLEGPTPYFLEMTAFPSFFPINQKVDEGNPDWATSPATLVNNGPFCLDNWQHQHLITLAKNQKYWDANTVKLDEVHFAIVSDETALKMFEMGELDWVGSPLCTIPVDALPSLQEKGVVKTKPLCATYFLRCNTEHPLLRSKNFRKALAVAVNREEIVTHILQGGQPVATTLVPSAMRLQEEPGFNDGDREGALSYLAAALSELDLPEGAMPEITLLYGNSQRGHLICQALQQQWQKTLGIHVKLEAMERKVCFERIAKQDFDLVVGDWVADYNDPLTFLDVFKFKVATTNNTGWEDSEYVRLLDQSMGEIDSDKRKELLSMCEKILIDAMPIIPVFEYTMLYMSDARLQDVVLSPMGFFNFKWARIEQGDVK